MKFHHQLLAVSSVLPVVVVLFICSGCFKNNFPPEEYYTDPDVIALCRAAQRDDITTIDRLVAKGVDVNKQGKKGYTPLFFAFSKKRKKSFEALLKHGADPNILVEHPIGTIIHAAAKVKDDSEWLELVLNHGGDPDAETITDIISLGCPEKTPLYIVIREGGSLKNVELLIKAGANVDHRDACGHTPAMYAASNRKYQIVYMLLQAGADWTLEGDYGHTLAETCYGTGNMPAPEFVESLQYRQKVLNFLRAKGVDLEAAKERAWNR